MINLDNILRVISTTSDKLDTIDIDYGQLIFSRDNRAIYFDTEERTTYQQIIPITSEEIRKKLVRPVNGFYFIISTGAIWRYDHETYPEWEQITAKPKEYVIYGTLEEFPAVGCDTALYVDKDVIYRYLDGGYVEMNSLKWGKI